MGWNKHQKSILGTVTIASFLGSFLVSSINIALPTIGNDMNMGAISLSWIITALLLATAMFSLPVGRWADVNGVKKVYKSGIVVFSLTTLLCGFSPSGALLIALRFFQGIGAAMTASTGTAILVTVFPPAQRGRVLGISVASVYLGLAMGPFFGGLLTQQVGWRSIFFICSLLGSVAAVIALIVLGKDVRVENPEKIEMKGVFVYISALIALICGSSLIPQFAGWILICAGIALFVVFFWVENRALHPVIDVKLFTRNRLFAFSNIAALINYTATFAIVFLLSLYLQHVKDMSPQEAGSILLVQPLVMSIFSPLTGRLSDRIQPRLLASGGMTLCAAGLAFFAFLHENTPVPLIITVLVVVGLGFSLFSSPNMNTIMSSVEKNQYGTASGVSSTMRVLGQMVSMTVVTLFFALFFGNSQVSEIPNPIFMKTVSILFAVFAAICAVGIRFSFKRGNIKYIK